MEAAAATQPSIRPWSDLLPDLLLDISGRLHDPTDFVRLHAVCTSWRHRLHSPATRPKFMPWPLSQCNDGQIVHSPVIYSRRVDVSSEAGVYDGNILTEPKGASSTCGGGRNFVASADGKAVWIFAGVRKPRLLDLVTGAVTLLPPFPYDDDRIRHRMSNPHGVIYSDGTVILYTFIYKDRRAQFYKAAILRPGDATWTVVQMRLMATVHCSGAAYRNDKILLCASMAMEWANRYCWCVLTPELEVHDGHETAATDLKTSLDGWVMRGVLESPGQFKRLRGKRNTHDRCYVIESRGELLRVSLLIERDWLCHHNDNDPSPTLSVAVHSPEEGADSKVQWVARDRWSLSDRVLFLGSPTSFAVDAAELGVGGGCAYFIFSGRVFRCSLVVDGEPEFVRMLPPGWGADGPHLWFRPQPAIAPMQEIRKRLETQI